MSYATVLEAVRIAGLNNKAAGEVFSYLATNGGTAAQLQAALQQMGACWAGGAERLSWDIANIAGYAEIRAALVACGVAHDGAADLLAYELSNLAIMPPGTPSLWFDAGNIDGLNNTSLVDGQGVGTWTNLGSVGAGGNLVQASAPLRPLYRAIATAGKINNRSGVENTGTMQMSTAALTVIPQPNITATVYRQASGAAAMSLNDNTVGGPTDRQLIQTNTGIVVNIYAGGGVVATGNVPALTTWETLLISWNGASTFGRLNGSQAANVNPGANGIGGWKIFNQSSNGEPWLGIVAEQLIWTGSLPSVAAIEAYFAAKYGATPQ